MDNDAEDLRSTYIGRFPPSSDAVVRNLPTADLLLVLWNIDSVAHNLSAETKEALHRLEQSCLV